VANNPMFKGGVLFVDSADKATRFIQLCDAFSVPLLFLADVPGFMVGTAVERQGIIRHGAKMISAVSEATVPKICVIVRKAYGAGLYAMAGPGFDPDATLALPTAKIAVMGAEAAVNAVYYNRLAAHRRRLRSGRPRPAGCAPSTRPTSTCCGWRGSSSSTTWSSRRTCGRS
jgi:acetyl-CoA carboxylase carboxyltransferase component